VLAACPTRPNICNICASNWLIFSTRPVFANYPISWLIFVRPPNTYSFHSNIQLFQTRPGFTVSTKFEDNSRIQSNFCTAIFHSALPFIRITGYSDE
jgi:hypothetical protein